MPKSPKPPRPPGPRERRDLEIEMDFLEGLVRRAPADADVLRLLGDDYSRAGRHADSLRVDEHLAQLQPQDSGIHYNLACSYALTSQFEQSAAALIRSMELGFRDFDRIASDPDLGPLRKHPLYRGVHAKVRALQRCSH